MLHSKPQIIHGVVAVYLWISECDILHIDPALLLYIAEHEIVY